MKLYLDDIRNPHQSGYKDSEWIVCKNDKTFKDVFTSFDNTITHISFVILNSSNLPRASSYSSWSLSEFMIAL